MSFLGMNEPHAWMVLLTLTWLEIILGIDNNSLFKYFSF